MVSLSNHEQALRAENAPFDRLRANGGGGKSASAHKTRLCKVVVSWWRFVEGERGAVSFWVYILRCSDGSYYIGHTDSLERRIGQHSTGAIAGCYTFDRRPLSLVFSHEFSAREEALASERQIKGWGRKKKEAMIRGDWDEVSRLAHSSRDGLPVSRPGKDGK